MRIFLKRNSWLSSVFQRGTVTLSDCSAPHFLPTVITGALWPGPGELLQRGGLHLEGEMLAGMGEGRKGMGPPCGTRPAGPPTSCQAAL